MLLRLLLAMVLIVQVTYMSETLVIFRLFSCQTKVMGLTIFGYREAGVAGARRNGSFDGSSNNRIGEPVCACCLRKV